MLGRGLTRNAVGAASAAKPVAHPTDTYLQSQQTGLPGGYRLFGPWRPV